MRRSLGFWKAENMLCGCGSLRLRLNRIVRDSSSLSVLVSAESLECLVVAGKRFKEF